MGIYRFILSSKDVYFVLSSGEKPSILSERRDPSIAFPGISDEAPELLLFWCFPVIVSYFYQVVDIVPVGFSFFPLGCCFHCSVCSLCFTTFSLFLLLFTLQCLHSLCCPGLPVSATFQHFAWNILHHS